MEQTTTYTVKNIEYKYFSKGKNIDTKSENMELLGFKESYPVLKSATNVMDNATSTKVTKKPINISEIKYIFLNGKKVKVVPLVISKKTDEIKTSCLKSSAIKNTNTVIQETIKKSNGEVIKIIGKSFTRPQNPNELIKIMSDDLERKVNGTGIHHTIKDMCKKSVQKRNILSITDLQSSVSLPLDNYIKNNDTVNQKKLCSQQTNHEKRLLTNLKTYDCKKSINDLVKKEKCNKNAETTTVDLIKTSSKFTQIITTTISKSTQTVSDANSTTDQICINNSKEVKDLFDPLHSTSFSLLKYINSNSNSPRSTNIVTQNFEDKNKIKLQFHEDLRNCLSRNTDGNLPIHVAVIENNLPRTKQNCVVLKIRNVEIDILNHDNFTPLQLAIIHKSSEDIIKLLLSYGADKNLIDSEGNSLLHLAVENNNIMGLKLLLTISQDIDCCNYDGVSPLILSCINKYHEAAKLLLDHRASPNLRDLKSGRTALFHAVQTLDVNLIKMVSSYGANTKVKNFFGTSPHDMMFEVDDMPSEIQSLILYKHHPHTMKRLENPKQGIKKRPLPQSGHTDKKTKYEKTDMLKMVSTLVQI